MKMTGIEGIFCTFPVLQRALKLPEQSVQLVEQAVSSSVSSVFKAIGSLMPFILNKVTGCFVMHLNQPMQFVFKERMVINSCFILNDCLVSR